MIIDRSAHDAMIEHMREAAPREGVGLLAGPEGPPRGTDPPVQVALNGRNVHSGYGVVDRWVPLRNTSDFPRLRYEVDPAELVNAWQVLEEDGRRPWVVCHSHTTTGVAPSPLDVRYAVDQSLLHLIVSLAGPKPVVRLWRLDPHALRPNPEARVRFQVVDLGFRSQGTSDLTHRVTGPTV